jgi:2-polyprenyl-6-methoxyphenol hydroxylase-like FAD-dependent oxidoreductase
MKVVIIGGGIAGLTAAIALKKVSHKVVVRERFSINSKQGMAFMIHSDTLKSLQSLTSTPLKVIKYKINDFLMLGDSGNKQKRITLNHWYAVKRITLLKTLRGQLCDNEVYENSEFSHLKYEGSNAIAAVFKDGSIEYGDVFIGADGISSMVRKFVCDAHFFKNQINEFVCIIKNEEANFGDHSFRKFNSIKKGMAFGYIPISSNEHVWFLQFNSKLYSNLILRNRDNIAEFRSKLLAEVPRHIRELIEKSDFRSGHLWISKELKLLSSYYKNNVCLIGDAAHGSIPLTSSGVSNGISSAIELAKRLNSSEPIGVALEKYEEARKRKNKKTIEFAKTLKSEFINGDGDLESYHVPLFK